MLVVAPKRMSRRSIHRMLELKAGHVSRFLQQARSKQQDLAGHTYDSGGEHLYLGTKRVLVVDEQRGRRGAVRLGGEEIHVQTPERTPECVKNLLTRWYRRQAEQLFTRQLAYYSALASWTGGQVPVMRLRSMKRTWGSCSSAGIITLNPHLVKAPAECIDYVIAHEVCHLREHNHGRAFYSLQEQLYPQWRGAKALLRERGHIFLHA